MDSSYAKQPDKPKSVARVLGGAVSKNYRHHCYDTSKYAVHVLGGAVSKTYRRFPESRVYRYIITTLSRTQVVTAEVAISFQSYQGEVNPQVGHEIPGAEEGAQMMQLTQVQLAQIVFSAMSKALTQYVQQRANNPPLAAAASTAAVQQE